MKKIYSKISEAAAGLTGYATISAKHFPLISKAKGFTLIELLVVIAIIGILSSVVLASLSTARAKSRDAKRISDIGQIQLALELYFDSSSSYPILNSAAASAGTSLSPLVPTYMPKIPTDPKGASTQYFYGGTTTSYVLGSILERDDNAALASDSDAGKTAKVFTTFDGDSADCIGGGTKELCYDVTN